MRLFLLLIFLVHWLLPYSVSAQNALLEPPKLEDSLSLPPPSPKVHVASAILYDPDRKKILFEQNADALIPPASLTKIMSMFVVLDAISQNKITMQTQVPVSRAAANEEGSRMGIREGDVVRLGDLLQGMAISSGNDASYAVAEFVGGNRENFIAMMNRKAKSLHMTSSHFETPNGLPKPSQLTSARDMLILADNYLQKYPWTISVFHSQRVLKYHNYVSWNKNPLLDQYPGANGLKSGWVRSSGHNLIFSAERAKKRLLGVILGAPSASDRAVEACRLLDAGFLYCFKQVNSVEEALDLLDPANYTIDLHKGAKEAIQLYGYVSQGSRGKRVYGMGKKKSVNREKSKPQTRKKKAPKKSKPGKQKIKKKR